MATSVPDISQILSEVESQIGTLAQSTVSNFKDQAIADGKTLLNDVKNDVSRWTFLLSTGQLKIAEFEFLVGSQRTLVKMISLEQAGLAELRVLHFAEGVLNIVIDVVLKTVVGNAIPIPVPKVNLA
ncbi:hypothetical protein [Deminuibacter soli]|uniref:Uncharacterized protein n=1 Tax=Deminuibacter soli TaxID=2291815 RepID=A0A3E1NQB9_9BACT|nr:hypothetical protein [Deminuibacter soli]RFM30097.1 hypothetical protein DXN05_03745 [Deminuibacter soli]